ncbi:MAG: CtkA family protein [Bacillota bacterium]|nr:CtkA family protein [Bacillota bacterium]
MTEMVDFTGCGLSPRNLEYGGRAGEKRGIVFDEGFYILKFPKNTLGMDNVRGISYVTSPLSEYIGSHIYEILGYDAQKTVLGICHDGKRYKVVCACKDFIEDDKNELLIPYTALRNDASPIIASRNDESFVSPSNINEIIFQLEHNTVLGVIGGAKERFFDVAIIDMLINNNDRHEDNWGVIKFKDEGRYVMAPIFDCGNCFYGKSADERIRELLSDPKRLYSSATNGVTAYEDEQERRIRNEELVKLDNGDLRKSMKKIASLVGERFDDIVEFINGIPSSFMDVAVMSDERKRYYIETFRIRYEEILLKSVK